MSKDFALGRFYFLTGTFRARRWHRFLPLYLGPAYYGRKIRGLSLNVFAWAWYACAVPRER